MGKYKLSIITAHNGTEVLSLVPTTYVHTIFDDIIADWRRQQIRESRQQREEETSLKNIMRKLFRRKRK